MLRALLALPLFWCAGTALGDDSPRFRFEKGQVFAYSLSQEIKLFETTLQDGKPVIGESTTKLTIARKFEVKSVEKEDAELEMTITAMRQEIQRPAKDTDGKPVVDRTILDSAEGEGKEKMAAFINKPIATVKLNKFGKVLDVKCDNAMFGNHFKMEPPFRIDFPEKAVAVGESWDREFEIKLDPPVGTGEKYAAIRTCKCGEEVQGRIVVSVATTLKKDMKVPPTDMPALIPYLWIGEVYLDKAGRYRGAKLSIKGESADHQGAGTKFVYESTYVEAPVEK